jgi:hypothetical protein
MKLHSTNVIYVICSHEQDLCYDRHPDAHHSYVRTCTYLKLVCILQKPKGNEVFESKGKGRTGVVFATVVVG